MTTIVAIDPGLTFPAACFSTGGIIQAAERVKIPGAWDKLEILDRCDRIGEAVVDWIKQHKFPIGGDNTITLIVEWPQWYGKDADKQIDPNDLAGLCGIAGSVCGRLRQMSWREVVVRSPRPREVWGNVPKATKGNPWKSPRGMKLERRLKPGEREVIQSKHDALDAAGLAMYADGRWAQQRLYPGAV